MLPKQTKRIETGAGVEVDEDMFVGNRGGEGWEMWWPWVLG